MATRKKSPAPARKPAARKPAKKAPAPRSVRIVKVHKPKAKPGKTKAGKVKLVRDSFTMPKGDYDLIDMLKKKALEAKVAIKKSQLLRAGLHALNRMQGKDLLELVGSLSVVKTGRPRK